jgi:ribosome biogenesis protein ENP2
MELKSYQKLVSAINPFAFEKFKKDQVDKRLREQQEKRINIKSKKATVNVDYIKELEKREQESGKHKKKSQMQAKEALADNRFGQMYEDPDFVIDKRSENYKAIKTTVGNDSDEEEKPKAGRPEKPSSGSLNQLFSGKTNTNDESDEEKTTFEKKMNNKHKKTDKIIKNYSEINKKMREKGE